MAEIQRTKDAPESHPSYIEGMAQFVKDSWAELHRVQWPNQETIIKHTTVVVCLVIFMAAYVGAWDAFWTWAFHHLLHIGTTQAGS